MTRNRSYTFATSGASLLARRDAGHRVGLALLTLLALGVRAFRLDWQPLWWDEGYSVYFATEPPARMLWLTARDIHPPLYYGLLHGWYALFGATGPEVARALSVLCGVAAIPLMAALANSMRPQRARLALIAALLLAISPIHLFYSQEVRMYGLALLLSLSSTIAFWQWVKTAANNARAWPAAAVYLACAALSLWTLYYSGLLIAAHFIWALFYFRRQPRRLVQLATLALALLGTQLPWWLYALPKLLPYVADKVVSDQDMPLLPWDYLYRHLPAFMGGHLRSPDPRLAALRPLGMLGYLALVLPWLRPEPPVAHPEAPTPRQTRSALATFTLVPLLLGYLINLRLPFFPDGGERLLLTVLPLILLWMAWGLDWRPSDGLPRGFWTAALAVPVLLAAGAGIATFYTLPRHTDHDYRPIVRYVTQHSRDQDAVIALFPWQVGYWRAYGVRQVDGTWLPPQPAPLDQDALVWNQSLAESLDRALQTGTVWFPAPVSFGSSLPGEIEDYLAKVARNLDNRWFSPATRLSAWVQMPTARAQPTGPILFGSVPLTEAAVEPTSISAANVPIAVDLTWAAVDGRNLHVTLRLLDAAGHVWAARDYEPLGSLALPQPTGALHESFAFLIPAGLPPQPYTLAIGVGPRTGDQFFPDTQGRRLVPLATLQVTAPSSPLHPARLAADFPLEPAWSSDGVFLMGFDGAAPNSAWLAGTSLPLRLSFWKTDPPPTQSLLWLGLRAENGQVVTSWSGWPLPDHPIDAWPSGALVQMPAPLNLPATLEAGAYRLEAALLAPGEESPARPAHLAPIRIERRPHSQARAEPQVALAHPPQLGTHARLYGYTLKPEPGQLQIELDWEVLQTLLPAHDIFVHLVAPDGVIAAQDDGPPVTSTGPAPTGSWLPGEMLRTQHTLPLPPSLPADLDGFVLRVGLYEPTTWVRLPVTTATEAPTDSVTLPLNPPPD